MINLFQIDKSGNDIFEKDYSIALIKDKEEIYGINVPQDIKDKLVHLFKQNDLNIESTSLKKQKLRFKIRFHTAIIILLIEKAIKDEGRADKINIQICNDIDGHFHEIRDMIYGHLSKLIPSLQKEDIVQTKFQKTSLVDIAARNLREKNNKETINYIIPKIDIEKLIKLIKK
jgi:hypothetical protein